jgi:hypothetical protein
LQRLNNKESLTTVVLCRESKAAELRSLDSSPHPGMTPEELEALFQTLGSEMALLESEAALLQADFDMLYFYRWGFGVFWGVGFDGMRCLYG